MTNNNVVKLQGPNRKDISQNYWVDEDSVTSYCEPIKSEVDLINTLNQIN